jgi:hypothetical protein
MPQVKFVVAHISNISCVAIATEVGISPASVYHILTNSLGKGKVCTKWIPHLLDNEQRATCVFCTTINLQCWRHEGKEILYCIFAVEKSHMHSD